MSLHRETMRQGSEHQQNTHCLVVDHTTEAELGGDGYCHRAVKEGHIACLWKRQALHHQLGS